ncbi:hypothetical protein CPB97_000033 [Podila verticillata]|nr:hypothetical protein CPB97_000033 [Podila verticillata]
MTPPKKTATTTKHVLSPDAFAEPTSKRSRQSRTKDKATTAEEVKEEGPVDRNVKEEPYDTHVKSEQPKDADQAEESSSRSTTTARRSARSNRSLKTETGEKIKEEPDDGSQQEEDGGQRVIEKGHAFFFYRPKIDVDKPSSTDDVQKLYMLLSPDNAAGRLATEDKVRLRSKPSHTGKPRHRLLIIPQKSLPSPGKGPESRVWAFVDEASADLEKLENRLERYTYSTKTRGRRTQESARLIGEARYDIILDHNHSYFVYELEVPQLPGEVQHSFNILKEGQFLMQVKNPEIQTPATERGQTRYATLGRSAAKLPKHLQERFRGIRKEWVRHRVLDCTEFLDVRHVEVVLFAVNKDAKEEFDEMVKVLEAEVETEVKEEEGNEIDGEKKPEDHAFKELNLDEEKIPAAIEEFK